MHKICDLYVGVVQKVCEMCVKVLHKKCELCVEGVHKVYELCVTVLIKADFGGVKSGGGKEEEAR